MRHSEAIMPCISFNIIIGKNVDSFLFAERIKGAVFVLGIEEFSVFVP